MTYRSRVRDLDEDFAWFESRNRHIFDDSSILHQEAAGHSALQAHAGQPMGKLTAASTTRAFIVLGTDMIDQGGESRWQGCFRDMVELGWTSGV